MKHFIYLDNDVVDSIIAQKQGIDLDKSYYDDAFDVAYEHIKEYISNDSNKCGDYIDITKPFEVIDLEYLEKLISNKMLIESISDQEGVDAIEKSKETMELIKCVIPSKKMLISPDGYIIPLCEDHFKVCMPTFAFMYGGEITCVGVITNIVGESIESKRNMNSTLRYVLNLALKDVLHAAEDKKVYIIHPIGIYYNK